MKQADFVECERNGSDSTVAIVSVRLLSLSGCEVCWLMLPTLSFLTGSEFLTSQMHLGSIWCKNVESFPSSVLSGEANPKERTRRARFHHRLLRNMLAVLTPCESDVKSYGCDIFHLCTSVIRYSVSSALAYTFAGPLSLKQNGVFTYHTTSGCTDPHWSRLLLISLIDGSQPA